MQFDGFVLGHIEVEIQGRAYDLHNFYQVKAINYDILSQLLVLNLERWEEAWVPEDEARRIKISFHGVDYFSASGQLEHPIVGDDRIIHSIGVVGADEETRDTYLTDNIHPDHHLVICFESGLTLRVQAAEARCELTL